MGRGSDHRVGVCRRRQRRAGGPQDTDRRRDVAAAECGTASRRRRLAVRPRWRSRRRDRHHALTGAPRTPTVVLAAAVCHSPLVPDGCTARIAAIVMGAAAAVCRLGEPARRMDCGRRCPCALDLRPPHDGRTATAPSGCSGWSRVTHRHACHAVWVRTLALSAGNRRLFAA